LLISALGWALPADLSAAETRRYPSIELVLKEAAPLQHERGERLPLYLWPARTPDNIDEKDAERLIRALNKRGIGLISGWHIDARRLNDSLANALTVARVQNRLGLRVNVNATSCLYSFFNGDPRTAHIDDHGKTFWDDSFGKKNMGCPFTLNFRRPAIQGQVEFFVKAYEEAGVDLDFVFADWEIDGPIEFNRAHAASMKCRRCRRQIADIEDFATFQVTLRELRSELQRECYAQPVLSRFPQALVGNYAVYPHNGLRYWYDYFEYYVTGQPHSLDQRAKYRIWYQEFPLTGYTFAMPVVYTWYPTFNWYDFSDPDYRWFYNMLLVASNAGEHTSPKIPIISFVHWHTTSPPVNPDPRVKQFSGEKYQELLWHMLLRGTDTFFLWCPSKEAAKEIRLLHPVWAAAQEYGEFLDNGVPVSYQVPSSPAPVVSGLRLGKRVLVRRTDFGKGPEGPITVKVGGSRLTVAARPGECQILELD
jgi:hypothetical protein